MKRTETRQGKISVVTPFAGYERPYLDEWMSCLLNACRVRSDLELLWMDNSCDDDFHTQLQREALAFPAPTRVMEESIRLSRSTKHPDKIELTQRRDLQVAMMYQRAQGLVDTEWVVALESDVLIQSDTVEKLLQAMASCSALAAISANVPYIAHVRSDNSWLVLPTAWVMPQWEGDKHPDEPVTWHRWHHRDELVPDGVEVVDGVSFGCLLMYTETFRSTPLSTNWPVAQYYGFDQMFCRDLRNQGMLVGFHWGAPVGHMACGKLKSQKLTEYKDLATMVDDPLVFEVAV